ncbi:MAG TPA: acyl-CoA dehydrogenase family protein [Polyangia bacterium]
METKWIALAEQLGKDFGTRAADHDRDDSFVAENYAKLREHRAFGAGVPSELEGGGATHAELCEMVRALARQCGSTGLAYAMHTHLVATLAYLWRAGNKAPEGLLKRVAGENLILVSTGASDWLTGSGTLEKVEGGYRLTGKKIFGSGSPAGDLLMTTGVYDDPKDGPTVYHFPLSLKAEGVTVLDTWRTLGMRGTGSHDVEIKNAFLPDQVMQGVRRPSGKWHPFIHTVVLVALPIIYSAYVGIAETARSIALDLASRKKTDPLIALLAGELENQVVAAQVALESMIALVTTAKPGPATTAAVSTRRALVVNSVLRAVDKALELAGGAGFYRSAGLERCFRDAQGVRFHPIPEKSQTLLAGRVALGLDIDG